MRLTALHKLVHFVMAVTLCVQCVQPGCAEEDRAAGAQTGTTIGAASAAAALSPNASTTSRAAPAQVVQATPDEQLTAAFRSLKGWTGGDAAYSLPLGAQKQLWLFGDSFIGEIKNKRRTKMEMVHNSAAWQEANDPNKPAMRFFWKANKSDLLSPRGGKAYYWPGAATIHQNKLAIFCKKIVNKSDGPPGFAFDWLGQDLVIVHNPQSDPRNWQYQSFPLPQTESGALSGSACIQQGEWLYVFGTIKNDATNKCILARIELDDLIAGRVDSLQFWSRSKQSDTDCWSGDSDNLLPLFSNAATEMSVNTIQGLPGIWSVYTESSLGPRIVARQAPAPEGPWSEPLLLYTAPEASSNSKLLCYGAKNHPELATAAGELRITYCTNPGTEEAHRKQPMTYFPRAVTVKLKPAP